MVITKKNSSEALYIVNGLLSRSKSYFQTLLKERINIAYCSKNADREATLFQVVNLLMNNEKTSNNTMEVLKGYKSNVLEALNLEIFLE